MSERAKRNPVPRRTGPDGTWLYWVGDGPPRIDAAPAAPPVVPDAWVDLDPFDEPTVEVRRPAPVSIPPAPAPSSPHDSDVRMIAWVSDVHVPEHDGPAVRAFLSWLRDTQPDEVILGGDIAEMGSCSEHGGVAAPAALLEDIDALRLFCLDVRRAAPAAEITFLEGNHETRIKRVVVSRLPTFDGAIDIPSLCGLHEMGIAWVPFGRLLQRGKLRFVHGVYANEHHAAQHLRRFGCSLVYGHTHRAQMHSRATADLEMQAAFAMPSMRSLSPEWMGGGPSGWGHGFGVCYVLPDGSFSVYTVLITRGRFVWSGKVYDGGAP